MLCCSAGLLVGQEVRIVLVSSLYTSYLAHPTVRMLVPAPDPPIGPVIAGWEIRLRLSQPLEAGQDSGLLFL